jgi:hypothetical protein
MGQQVLDEVPVRVTVIFAGMNIMNEGERDTLQTDRQTAGVNMVSRFNCFRVSHPRHHSAQAPMNRGGGKVALILSEEGRTGQ